MTVRKNIAALTILSVLACTALASGTVAWGLRSHSVPGVAAEAQDLKQHIQSALALTKVEASTAIDAIAYQASATNVVDAGPLLEDAAVGSGCAYPRAGDGHGILAGIVDPRARTYRSCGRDGSGSQAELPDWAWKLIDRTSAGGGQDREAWAMAPEGAVLLVTRALSDGSIALAASSLQAALSVGDFGTRAELVPWSAPSADWPAELEVRLNADGLLEATQLLFDVDNQPVSALHVVSLAPVGPAPWTILLPLVVGAVVVGAAGVAMGRRAVDDWHELPLAEMAMHVRRASTDGGSRVRGNADPGLAALASAINQLVEEHEQVLAEATEARQETDGERHQRLEVITVISDELRVASDSVRAGLELVGGLQLPENAAEPLRVARGAVDGITALAEHIHLLDPERPPGMPRSDQFDVQALLEEVVAPLRHRAATRQIDLRVPAPEVPAGSLLGDVAGLRRLIDSLVGHRVASALPGVITLTVTWRAPGVLSLSLNEETRPGAAPPAAPSPTRDGLMMTRLLTEALRGELHQDGRRNVPFSVRIDIPIVAAPNQPPDEPRTEGRRRVLLVDDNHVNLFVAEKTLTGAGYDVVKVDSGIEALRLQGTQQFDVVLMDIAMPVLDGVATTLQWREREKGSRTPIIALSAMVSRDDVSRCQRAGMDDFIPKPFRTHDLLNAIASVLTRYATQVR